MSKIDLAVIDGAEGDVFTLDNGKYLCLHFDGFHIQSMMAIDEPFKLCFSYVQAMMAFKLFNSNPQNILIVGLGGGSLSKHCHVRFPDARIKTIEISHDVIALRDKFYIPQNSERFQIVQADARSYLPLVRETKDVILLDAFTSKGLPEDLCSWEFYENCYEALRVDGIVVINLIQSDHRLYRILERISETFYGNCLIAFIEDCGNYIVVARKSLLKIIDDAQNDRLRLEIKELNGVDIPQFETFESFYASDY
ncbi:fused MFS/spermidine synthase [Asticcacaulis sp.]|uniref:fused MFS/spermidine synthase n=1 Tax=Asticcacaulis sp. TaxID=1872648 RepID=UPI002CD8789B|nr:fused MFS/spermidine synthase [Asticcacaulis sp.]HTM82802.1 fused MFS/spermidine synthase [Asticcacaulis sp.]